MEKQVITFKADEQGLIKTGGITNYASNTVSYIEATFVLGANWTGFDSVRAIWSNDYRKAFATVLDSDGKCIVPAEVLARTGNVKVNLVGSIASGGELTDRLTTYPILAVIVDANARVEGDETKPVTPSQFEQFVAIVKDDADRAETAAGNADTSAGQAEGYASDAEGYMQRAETAAETAETEVGKIIHLTASAETLSPGSQATASYDYDSGTLTLGIPQGATGATPNITIGSVTTLEPGSPATATITGTAENPVLNLGIPKGAKGDTGVGIESIYETGTSGAVHTYTILYTNGNTTTFNVTDGQVTNATLAAILAEYAKKEGVYPNLIAGNLDTSKSTTNTAPYLFRANPTKSDREYPEIVGGTVVVNQICKNRGAGDNGVTATVGDDGAFTLSGTATGSYSRIFSNFTPVVGHKYIYTSKVLANPNSIENVQWGFLNAVISGSVPTIGENVIGNVTASAGGSFGIKLTSSVNYTGYKFFANVIDLTQMLGTSIADRAYTLESGTAGAGIAWLKSYGFFTKPYYPYNAGSLQSVKTSAHRFTGVNQWDEVWQTGIIASNGTITTGNRVVSKNFIPVVSGQTYYGTLNKVAWVFYYSDNSATSLVSYESVTGQFTIPNGAKYIRFYTASGYGSTYNNDICINVSKEGVNGQYFPYVQPWSYTLPNTELRGLFKLDTNNNIYAHGDRQKSGSTDRYYGIVDLGQQNWQASIISGVQYFYISLSGKKVNNLNMICPKYITSTATGVLNSPDKSITASSSSDSVFVRDSAYSDPAAFKTAMDGVYLIYELATPTTETTADYDELQFVSPYGTEEYIDGRTVEIPVGHETKYPDNLKLRIEDIPDLPDTAGEYKLKVTVSGGVVSYSWV